MDRSFIRERQRAGGSRQKAKIQAHTIIALKKAEGWKIPSLITAMILRPLGKNILVPFLLKGTVWVLLFSITGCADTGSQSNSSSTSTGVIQESIPQPSPTERIPQSTTSTGDEESKLWSRLQQADTHYVVLMRHALAPGTGDPANFQLGDCSTQRNLSEEGRIQAKRTGEAFKQRGIQVQQVLSSQWCRCLETAQLMDIAPVKPFPPLNSFFNDRSTAPEQTAQLREFIVSHQDTNGVTVMVTHFVNISAISGSGVSSGEMVVMSVNNQNQLEVVGQIDAL